MAWYNTRMKMEAEVRQVKTMADMTVNVTLNLPEYHIAEAQQLLAMIGDLVAVEIHLVGGEMVDGKPERKRRQR